MSATRSQFDDVYKRDQKILVSEKENLSGKRDTETLLLAKDSGKQFTSGGSSVHLRGGECLGCCPLVDTVGIADKLTDLEP